MKRYTILLILFLLIRLTAVTAQELDSMKLIEQRLVLHALNDLYANAEVADSLYSEVKVYEKLTKVNDSIITSFQQLTLEQDKRIKECEWHRDMLLSEVNRKEKHVKYLLLLCVFSIILIPIL